MAIPDFQSCMRPLLAAVEDNQPHRFNDAFERLCEHFDLSEEDRSERLPSGKQTYIRNRAAWARTYMNKAGLLTAPARGMMQITERGQEALRQQPEHIDVRYLKQFPEFVEFHTAKSKPAGVAKLAPVDTVTSKDELDEITDPRERLEQAHAEIQQSLASDLLQTIRQQSPEFLEKLVVELMQAMGYGGWSRDSGKATQYSNDGGIDGIINEDPLGLDTIYLQAKRYTENTIHRPDIDTFIGALTRQGARKGVFITTSQFSSGAREAAEGLNLSIVLIDGQQLAELMIKHNLGVSSKETYQVKALDSDYFLED